MFQNIIEVLILSAIQGISEFLPISSSAHLILVSTLYEFKSSSLIIDILNLSQINIISPETFLIGKKTHIGMNLKTGVEIRTGACNESVPRLRPSRNLSAHKFVRRWRA